MLEWTWEMTRILDHKGSYLISALKRAESVDQAPYLSVGWSKLLYFNLPLFFLSGLLKSMG